MVHVIDLKFQGSSESIAAFILESDIGPILFETGPYSTFQTLKFEIEERAVVGEFAFKWNDFEGILF